MDFSFELGDGRSLVVNLTDEGIIIDAYDYNGEPEGTVGRTFEEWYDAITEA